MTKLAEYAKFVIATVTPVFLVIQAAATDGFSQQEVVAIVVAAVVAVGVLLKGNKAPAA